MTDIVERLRREYPQLNIRDDRRTAAWDAADEIERLRAEIGKRDDVIKQRDARCDRIEAEVERLDADIDFHLNTVGTLTTEIERLRKTVRDQAGVELRAALEQIGNAVWSPNTAFSTALLEVQSWARRALKQARKE